MVDTTHGVFEDISQYFFEAGDSSGLYWWRNSNAEKSVNVDILPTCCNQSGSVSTNKCNSSAKDFFGTTNSNVGILVAEHLRQFALRFPSCSNSVTTCGAISGWNVFWMNVNSLYELVFNCCFCALYLEINRYTVITNLSHLTTVATQTNLHGIVNLNPFNCKLPAHWLCLIAI